MKDEVIDARFYELGRRIAEFDSIREDIKSIQLQIRNIEGILSNPDLTFEEKNKETAKNISILQSKNSDSSIEIDSLKRLFSNLEGKISSLGNRISPLEQSKISHDLKISSIENSLISLVKIENNSKSELLELSQKQTLLNSSLRSMEGILNFLVNEAKSLKSLRDEIAQLAVKQHSDKDHFLTNQKCFEVDYDKFKIEIRREFASSCGTLSKVLSDKIDSIKIPSISHLADQASLDVVSAQLQSISLDAKNAMLKAGNVDVQNQLNVKKLENIQLTLKQIELTKQV